jgi:hypothetical protein
MRYENNNNRNDGVATVDRYEQMLACYYRRALVQNRCTVINAVFPLDYPQFMFARDMTYHPGSHRMDTPTR